SAPEQEEVVTQQLHLQRRFLGVHRLDREPFPLRDRRCTRFFRLAFFGVRIGTTTRPRAGAAVDTAFVEATHLAFDLVERKVECGGAFRGGGGALHEVMVDMNEDLTRVRVAGAPRLYLVVVDVDATYVVGELGHPLELLDGQRSQIGVDFYMLAED